MRLDALPIGWFIAPQFRLARPALSYYEAENLGGVYDRQITSDDGKLMQ